MSHTEPYNFATPLAQMRKLEKVRVTIRISPEMLNLNFSVEISCSLRNQYDKVDISYWLTMK